MTVPERLLRFTEPVRVLDHGHVKLVDVYGDDERVEAAARLSYEGQRKRTDTRALLRYLLRHAHTSPFEQCCITLDMKLPIFVARQLVRHRTAKLNEVSGRYTELPEEFYVPDLDQICYQATDNKQGRSGPLPEEEASLARARMQDHGKWAFDLYRKLLEQGIAKETARMVLPLSTYTHWCWTMDLHNLLHLLRLRMDPHAQWEIREYAGVIAGIVREWVPLTWEAFIDYRLLEQRFSRQEVDVLRSIVSGWCVTMDNAPRDPAWWENVQHTHGLTSRELAAFRRAIGFSE